MALKRWIDINCDLGEGIGNDRELMPFIRSCNIACGGHFGTRTTIRDTIRLAQKHQVLVGAHPSYPDREHFGRKRVNIDSTQLIESIKQQLIAFLEVCQEEDVQPNHIKLHGALYNVAASDLATAKLIFDVLQELNLTLPLYAPNNSVLTENAPKNIRIIPEAFIDRRYNADGRLVPRAQSNSLIEDPIEAWNQLKRIYFNKEVETSTNTIIPLTAETYCLHGDTENAVQIAEFVWKQLVENNISLNKG